MIYSTATVYDREFRYREQGSDRAVLQQIFEQRDYLLDGFAQATSLHLWSTKQNDLLIIDAGAYIGASAVWFAKWFPVARIVAIEPDPENYDLLVSNTSHLPQVTPILGAIGSLPGFGELKDPGRGEWAYRVERSLVRKPDAVSIFSVAGLVNSGTPFIFKCDIEGGEAELFLRNTSWVDRFPLIIIELHDWMLPGQSSSRNFLNEISGNHYFDVCIRGENLFCFNNGILAEHDPRGKD